MEQDEKGFGIEYDAEGRPVTAPDVDAILASESPLQDPTASQGTGDENAGSGEAASIVAEVTGEGPTETPSAGTSNMHNHADKG